MDIFPVIKVALYEAKMSTAAMENGRYLGRGEDIAAMAPVSQ